MYKQLNEDFFDDIDIDIEDPEIETEVSPDANLYMDIRVMFNKTSNNFNIFSIKNRIFTVMDYMDDLFVSYRYSEKLSMRDYRSMLLQTQEVKDPVIDTEHRYITDYFQNISVEDIKNNQHNSIIIDYLCDVEIQLPVSITFYNFYKKMTDFVKNARLLENAHVMISLSSTKNERHYKISSMDVLKSSVFNIYNNIYLNGKVKEDETFFTDL